MDETGYRELSGELVRLGCVFDKTILQRRAGCRKCRKINIAEREVVDCLDSRARGRCANYLDTLRRASRFALADSSHPLSFNRAVQLQTGAIDGLAAELGLTPPVANIEGLVTSAFLRWSAADEFPLTTLVRAVAGARGQRRVRRSRPRS